MSVSVGGTPGRASEYTRWVQSSLNQVLGLQLPIDGVMSPETRNAVRDFQRSKGLPEDGIVGPDTERALIEARSSAGGTPAAPAGDAGDGAAAAAPEGNAGSTAGNGKTGDEGTPAGQEIAAPAGRVATPWRAAATRLRANIAPTRPAGPRAAPTVTGTPRLLGQETTPKGKTLYAGIDLRARHQYGTVAPCTGIFIPEGYVPGPTVDVIVYLHGRGQVCESDRHLTIDQYWNTRRFAGRALREGVNGSGRNVILVAPTLGANSEAGKLAAPGGLDAFLGQVRAALAAYGGFRSAPQLGSLILAGHSRGGLVMRKLAGSGSAASRIREVWGFDSTYFDGDEVFWANWAKAHPNSRAYFYYRVNSPTQLRASRLRAAGLRNVTVQPVPAKIGHCQVPFKFWSERLRGATFLFNR